MKRAGETVGVANQLVGFDEVIEALEQGKMVRRKGVHGPGTFLFRQVPSMVGIDIIPKMTSLPQSVKDEFSRRFELYKDTGDDDLKKSRACFESIRYSNQVAIVGPDNNIENWSPSVSDIFSQDWMVL